MTVDFGTRAAKIAAAVLCATSMFGCEGVYRAPKNIGDYLNFRNGLLDPSQVGRFDKANPWGTSKPVTWPILDQLDMIDEPNEHWIMASDPLPSDLVVETKEYVVGEGDVINISVFELVTPGLPYTDQKQVNELGNITLQNLGQVHVAGLAPSQIEKLIGDLAVEKGFLLGKGNGAPGPQVSVQLYQSRARVFSALGQVGASGTYNIIGTDFRLLDALALAHDIQGGSAPGMDYLYVIRPVKNAGVIPADTTSVPASAPATAPLKSLDNLEKKSSEAPSAVPAIPVAEAPVLVREVPKVMTLADVPAGPQVAQANLDAAIGAGTAPAPSATASAPAAPGTPVAVPATGPAGVLTPQGSMIYVDGKWVPVDAHVSSTMTAAEAQAAASGMGVPRVIRIPINRLKEGDPRYNIVIHPGDVINVPNIEPGEFYLLGHVGRPGVYTLTGRKVTLKQAIAASGGLDAVAIPRRCDLIRRIGTTEVTVQVDLQRIFDGEQPDIFLKPNDLVNVGTDMLSPILAVTRNAYRASYGWGFIYDRNLYNQPVITQSAH
jgi:polysaccharide export outer membrane protein